MRTIDADELRNIFRTEFLHDCIYEIDVETVIELIDNAPTVELTETEIQEVLNKRCMTVVSNEYLIALHGKRPTKVCPWCHETIIEVSNFCPHCGWRLKGGEENDRPVLG